MTTTSTDPWSESSWEWAARMEAQSAGSMSPQDFVIICAGALACVLLIGRVIFVATSAFRRARRSRDHARNAHSLRLVAEAYEPGDPVRSELIDRALAEEEKIVTRGSRR